MLNGYRKLSFLIETREMLFFCTCKEWVAITFGVLQGPLLGLRLFLVDTKEIVVYINAHIQMILFYMIADSLLEPTTQDT